MNRIQLVIAAAAIACAFSTQALAAPAKKTAVSSPPPSAIAIPVANENRIVRYTFSPDVIFRIYTQQQRHTHIELGEDEGLVEKPQLGDNIQWASSGGPRNLYVKPRQDNIETSMTVVTTKRTYQFQLIAGTKDSPLYQKVSFDYPDRDAEIRLQSAQVQTQMAAVQARMDSQIVARDVDPANLNFAYKITGNAPFRPTTVYDDGRLTYLRLPAVQDQPVVMLVDENDNPSIINYGNQGDLIIVQRVADHLMLMLGDAKVHITADHKKSKN